MKKTAKKLKGSIVLSNERQQSPAMIYLAGLPKESSRINQRYDMDALARQFGAADAFSYPWENLRYQDMTIIQTGLLEKYKPRTAARIMCAIKGTLRAAWKMRLMSADDYQTAIDIPTIKRGRSITGRALSVDEIAALLKTCRTGAPLRGTRDAAIIMLMAGCGLRLNEITHAMLSDYTPSTGVLIVHGKGGGKDGKLRQAYLTNGTKTAVEGWLALRGNDSGALFCPVRKSDELIISPMANITVWDMLKKRGQAAGLQPFTPHDLRRTFISRMLDLTDLATVARLAGHEDVATTAGYDRRSIQHTQDAAGLLSIPFTPREDDID